MPNLLPNKSVTRRVPDPMDPVDALQLIVEANARLLLTRRSEE